MSGNSYDLHFIDEETEVWKMKELAQGHLAIKSQIQDSNSSLTATQFFASYDPLFFLEGIFPEDLRQDEVLIKKIPPFEGGVEAGRGISHLLSSKHGYLQLS